MTMTMTNYGFRFQNWDIYKDARRFRIKINEVLKTYPKEEKYALDEVVACLDCALDDKYIIEKEYELFLKEATSLAKRLRAFTEYLNKNSQR